MLTALCCMSIYLTSEKFGPIELHVLNSGQKLSLWSIEGSTQQKIPTSIDRRVLAATALVYYSSAPIRITSCRSLPFTYIASSKL